MGSAAVLAILLFLRSSFVALLFLFFSWQTVPCMVFPTHPTLSSCAAGSQEKAKNHGDAKESHQELRLCCGKAPFVTFAVTGAMPSP